MGDTSDGAATGATAGNAAVEWRLFAELAETAARGATVEVPRDATARDALDALLDAHPDLRDRVIDDGELADHLTVLRNGNRVDALAAPVADGDELALMPPVSGG